VSVVSVSRESVSAAGPRAAPAPGCRCRLLTEHTSLFVQVHSTSRHSRRTHRSSTHDTRDSWGVGPRGAGGGPLPLSCDLSSCACGSVECARLGVAQAVCRVSRVRSVTNTRNISIWTLRRNLDFEPPAAATAVCAIVFDLVKVKQQSPAFWSCAASTAPSSSTTHRHGRRSCVPSALLPQYRAKGAMCNDSSLGIPLEPMTPRAGGCHLGPSRRTQ